MYEFPQEPPQTMPKTLKQTELIDVSRLIQCQTDPQKSVSPIKGGVEGDFERHMEHAA